MNIPKNQIRLSITSSCNMKCIYCHNEGNIKSSKLTIENIEKLIQSFKPYGLEDVRLTGGDPFTHPDIIEICKMIKDKYNLKVSVNTNCVAYDKLLDLSKSGYIDRIVIGLDYFDGDISKNSTVGVQSKIILERIIELKKYIDNISVDIVYSNNKSDILKLIKWGILNEIRVKVIEIEENETADKETEEYLNMMKEVLDIFKFEPKLDDNEEINGYIGDYKAVSFLHSLCRIRRCDICKKIQLRINSEGVAKPCIFYSNQDVNMLDGDIDKNVQKILCRKVDYHYLKKEGNSFENTSIS